MIQGFMAARELGVFPYDTNMITYDLSPAGIYTGLIQGPLVSGNMAHAGWRQSRMHKHGYIDESTLPVGGGHATLKVALEKTTSNYIVSVLLNSWGDDWGVNGYGVMSITHDILTSLCRPAQAVFSERINTHEIPEDLLL